MSKSLNDEQTAIVHALKTLLSVRSRNDSSHASTLNVVNDRISLSGTV